MKPQPPDLRGMVGNGRHLTRPMPGFDAQLTMCRPREEVELTKYLFDPGHEQGFNSIYAFSKGGTEAGI